jgi:hypothetical protein
MDGRLIMMNLLRRVKFVRGGGAITKASSLNHPRTLAIADFGLARMAS